MKVKMWSTDGISCNLEFTRSNGWISRTWFSSPPKSIDHV